MKKKNVGVIAVVAALVVAGGWYFNQGNDAHAEGGTGGPGAAGPGGARPPVTVNVVAPQRRDVGVELFANGTVTPLRTVDLHPQTTSTIRKVHIREGDFVKEGQLMFTLDDRADQANVARADAQVARDRATLADLERQYKRSQELVSQNFLAQSALDSLLSQVEAQRALVQSNQAAARSAQVSASYTAIRAPMSGRVGAIDVHPGSLVQMATSLTSITQLDPINVSFTLPESALGSLLAAQKSGQVEVRVNVGNGNGGGEEGAAALGKLSFIDNAVDAQAGTIRVKGEFANGDTRLWPGQYVTAHVTVQTLKDAVVIPQGAIVTQNNGIFVYVVGEGNAARQVPVKRVHAYGDQAVVTGLNGNEQVITEGKQNLRPGGKVRLAGAAAGSKPAAPVAKKGEQA
ncbi:efflux RND transporter periplasmic adaptor subunit [Massilia sp. YIM B02443]|uniref:efflux RND transporter periplasmic adaptor subunit n=1 Tax=Massilia sp. YIM B02443 TaxID=3050127 RepID=UPI0025B67EBA|nr:efflux RND transporter periplasmic adaptor subunit [Massilia sp. YIM B02443]MDN4039824.1 efflux RND transporter periplasmic adaptor subunit [Massilia sp. YIM B02443]